MTFIDSVTVIYSESLARRSAGLQVRFLTRSASATSLADVEDVVVIGDIRCSEVLDLYADRP